MNKDSQHLFEFGPFRLDSANHLLLRQGQPVALPPKAFDTLLLLVQRRGALLEREALLKTVWPDTFVEENNLTHYISMLRKALGDGENGNNFIETVPKLGYRFVADVRELGGENGDLIFAKHTRTQIVVREQEEQEVSVTDLVGDEQGVPALDDPRPSVSTRQSRFLKLAAISLTLVVFGWVAYRSYSRTHRIAPVPAKPQTLAVLPFRNLRGDAETEYLSLALADSVSHRLGYISELVVRPTAYVAKFRNSDIDPREAARELHVQTLLTGSYVKEGDDLRIATELIDVQKGEVLWQDTTTFKYMNLLKVQDTVAEGIARRLRLALALSREVVAPQNPLAYEYFLRGQDLGIRNDYRTAIQMLEKSVELDPSYAQAWTALGLIYNSYAVAQRAGPEYSQKARSAFDRARALNPDQPPAQIYTAIVLTETGKAGEAVPMLREVLKNHPNHALARWWLSYTYRYGGALQESLEEGERAVELDPAVAKVSTFNTYLYLGQYQKFLESLPKAEGDNVPYYYLRSAPRAENTRTTFYRGLAYYYLSDFRNAVAEFDRAHDKEESLAHTQIGLALRYAITGERQKGVELLNQMQQDRDTDPEILYKIAQAYAVLGEKDSALRAFRLSVDQNFFCYPYFQRDPLLDNLRGERQFAQTMEEARQKHESFHRRFFGSAE